MSTRYALYVAPAAHSDLWRFGCAILGYDAETGAETPQLVPPSFAPDAFHALTEDPRRYGFHATMKAPFRLAEDASEDALISELRDFCAARTALRLPRLEVRAVGANDAGDAFVALIEPEPTLELLALERDLVIGFDHFRATLTEAEIARRRPERLSEGERENLMRWGYPGVLDHFRFHLTLTGRAPAADVARLEAELATLHAAHVPDDGLLVDQIGLFVQRPGERFVVRERVLFV
ncbi:DUF1045 domain-containing protein [Salinarimonas ramus]|uniref:Phosphonate metabolism protein n=1 Tax=Salinarimonas ramus TaxID=690164 RepID=A0A917V2Z3_9HYPH|nr:DUF1045 domain-containing protein [Salinarimonas ramus]GGK26679.1 hypothetical protein GCM10011322_11400 [Salinarimonas ramus]